MSSDIWHLTSGFCTYRIIISQFSVFVFFGFFNLCFSFVQFLFFVFPFLFIVFSIFVFLICSKKKPKLEAGWLWCLKFCCGLHSTFAFIRKEVEDALEHTFATWVWVYWNACIGPCNYFLKKDYKPRGGEERGRQPAKRVCYFIFACFLKFSIFQKFSFTMFV